MAAPLSRLLAAKVDAWIRMHLSELPVQRSGGKALAEGRLYG